MHEERQNNLFVFKDIILKESIIVKLIKQSIRHKF